MVVLCHLFLINANVIYVKPIKINILLISVYLKLVTMNIYKGYFFKLHLTVSVLFILNSISFYAQDITIKLEGNVYAVEGNIFDVHVINVTSKNITVTDKYGRFAILAELNDTLVLSSIQFKNKFFRPFVFWNNFALYELVRCRVLSVFKLVFV